jgi:hypothetical protein
MNNKSIKSKDPDILASPQALRRAARHALQIGKETGTPVYVIKKGRIVDIAAKKKRSRTTSQKKN